MRIGIDTSGILDNPRFDGGLNHLFELLRAGNPIDYGISKVIVWAGKKTLKHLDKLPQHAWLELRYESCLDGSFLSKLYWQRIKLSSLSKQQCDCLFIPSGSYKGSFRPFVTIASSFTNNPSIITTSQADGVIFFTDHSRKIVSRSISLKGQPYIIPHGVDQQFYLQTRTQKTLSAYSDKSPFRFLYVSDIGTDKHQLEVINATLALRKEGYPITLDLIGKGGATPYLKKIIRTLATTTMGIDAVRLLGPVEDYKQYYYKADAFVFVSESEDLPIHLLEAMASGLPIACSDCEPMPELLGDAGYYFNPTDSTEIYEALRILMESPSLRERSASLAYTRAQNYSWERCANETYSYIAQIAYRQPRYATLQNENKQTQRIIHKIAGR